MQLFILQEEKKKEWGEIWLVFTLGWVKKHIHPSMRTIASLSVKSSALILSGMAKGVGFRVRAGRRCAFVRSVTTRPNQVDGI